MIADQDSPTSKRGPSELDKSLKGKRESALRNGPSSLGLTIESQEIGLKEHRQSKRRITLNMLKQPSGLGGLQNFKQTVSNQKLLQKIQSNIQEARDVRSYLNQSISRIKEDVKYDSIDERIRRFEQFDTSKIKPFKPRLSIKTKGNQKGSGLVSGMTLLSSPLVRSPY